MSEPRSFVTDTGAAVAVTTSTGGAVVLSLTFGSGAVAVRLSEPERIALAAMLRAAQP